MMRNMESNYEVMLDLELECSIEKLSLCDHTLDLS